MRIVKLVHEVELSSSILALLKSLLFVDRLWGFYQVLSSLWFVRRLGLLSSTLGITVVVGFPFIASPESPCVSMLRWEAGNGRTSTAPHASSVVAWPIARQGFYSGQPTPYPISELSHDRSCLPQPSVTGSYDERLTC